MTIGIHVLCMKTLPRVSQQLKAKSVTDKQSGNLTILNVFLINCSRQFYLNKTFLGVITGSNLFSVSKCLLFSIWNRDRHILTQRMRVALTGAWICNLQIDNPMLHQVNCVNRSYLQLNDSKSVFPSDVVNDNNMIIINIK